MSSHVSRRDFLRSSLTAAALGPTAAALGQSPSPQAAPARKPIAISSANGLRAVEKAVQMIGEGADTLDAVIAGVNIIEEDPKDHSVGYGGLPNEEGVVELDSCCMHGPTNLAGAVAGLRGIKTPSKIARLVMQRTDHVLLVGEGAVVFVWEKESAAKARGAPIRARVTWASVTCESYHPTRPHPLSLQFHLFPLQRNLCRRRPSLLHQASDPHLRRQSTHESPLPLMLATAGFQVSSISHRCAGRIHKSAL
ncbi:MAG: isoaspartyl peptidase/L-asparaginase, partial [Planctomycetes bacterium]|nr:isoaspartyl peptidase/L-asparaginase [Planctomycetota bacterium]